jgi:hypothetical protein
MDTLILGPVQPSWYCCAAPSAAALTVAVPSCALTGALRCSNNSKHCCCLLNQRHAHAHTVTRHTSCRLRRSCSWGTSCAGRHNVTGRRYNPVALYSTDLLSSVCDKHRHFRLGWMAEGSLLSMSHSSCTCNIWLQMQHNSLNNRVAGHVCSVTSAKPCRLAADCAASPGQCTCS